MNLYTDNSGEPIITSGLANAPLWPGRTFFSDNDGYNLAHDYDSNPNTQEARLYPKGSLTYVVIDWEVQIDGGSTWYPITNSTLLTTLGATVNNEKTTLTFTYGDHYVSAVKASHNGDVMVDTTAGICLNYFDSFGNKKLTLAAPLPFTTAKNAGHYSFSANTSPFTATNRITRNAALEIIIKPKDVKINLKDKTVEYGLSKEQYETDLSKEYDAATKEGGW